ncbi:chitinase domain-containing protein 1, partial [Reticulomyxa filosa]
GYQLSIEYADKYTHIAPAWFQVKRYGTSFMIFGENDIDKKWIENLKIRSPSTRVVPRFFFSSEEWQLQDIRSIIYKKGYQVRLINKISNFLQTHQLDGAVVEFVSFFNWLATVVHDKKKKNDPSNNDHTTPDPTLYASEQRRLTTFIVTFLFFFFFFKKKKKVPNLHCPLWLTRIFPALMSL